MENTLPTPGWFGRLAPRALASLLARAVPVRLAVAPAQPRPTPVAVPAPPADAQPSSRTRQVYLVAFGYLVAISLGEHLTAAVEPQIGIPFHALLLLLVIYHGAVSRDIEVRNLLWTLSFAPLIRILSLALPLAELPFFLWYFVISVPLFATAMVLVPTLGYTRKDILLEMNHLRWQPLIMVVAPFLGFVEYLILRPRPLIPELTWTELAVPALVLLVSTGFSEELIFRGIMQRAAEPLMTRWPAAIYINLVFAVLHAGYLSFLDIVFVFVVGMLFSWFSLKTRTLLGVTLAHGLVNQFLFLVVPFSGILPPSPPS